MSVKAYHLKQKIEAVQTSCQAALTIGCRHFSSPHKISCTFSNSDLCQEFYCKNENHLQPVDHFLFCMDCRESCLIHQKCPWWNSCNDRLQSASSSVLMPWHIFQLSSNMFCSRLMIHQCVTADWPNEFKKKKTNFGALMLISAWCLASVQSRLKHCMLSLVCWQIVSALNCTQSWMDGDDWSRLMLWACCSTRSRSCTLTLTFSLIVSGCRFVRRNSSPADKAAIASNI